MTSYYVEENRYPKGWRVISRLVVDNRLIMGHTVAVYHYKEIAEEVADFLTDNACCEVET